MKRHPVLVFVLLTLILSWAWLIPVALASHGTIRLPLPAHKALIFSAYGPVLAALIATYMIGGLGGLQNLLGRFLRCRVGLQWYLIALLLPILPLLLHLLFGGSAPHFTEIRDPGPGAATPALTQLNP